MARMSIYYFALLLFFQQSDIVRSQELISTVALSAATLLGGMERKPGVSTLKKIKKVNLGDFPNYSVTIPLHYVPSTPQESVDDNKSHEKVSVTKSGKFIVIAPKGFGILAVVQEMDLPVLTITQEEAESDFEFLDPNQNKICKDYIQFSTGGKTGSNSEKICGNVSRENYDFKPSDLLGQRSFKSLKGKVIVLFHFSDTSDSFPLLQMSPETTGEEIHGNYNNKSIYKLEIVFTAYKDCNLQLNTDGGNLYMPCEISSSEEANDTCINSNLFCDENINCGFKSSSFASDENNCLASNTTFPIKSKKSSGSSFDVLTTFFTKMWKEGEKRILSISHQEKPSLIENPSLGKFLFHAAPSSSDSDRHTHSNHDGEDFEGIHFPTASGIILLIILAIVIVMSLSIVIRFCCFRCVGTPSSSNLLSTNNSDNITTSNSNLMYGAIPFPLAPRITETQPSNNFVNTFRNIAFKKDLGTDKPPSYDELFPSSPVDNKFDEDSPDIRNGFNEVGNINALPAAILNVDLTENSHRDSATENSHLPSSENSPSIWNNFNLRR